MEYPKIQTLWKRDKNNNFKIMEGKFSKEEFTNIINWDMSEKVDGTNIRIIKEDDGLVKLAGKTDNSQIPDRLLYVLEGIKEKVISYFAKESKFILFGEGYGGRIQTGKIYRPDESFLLFDAYFEDRWLERKELRDISNRLGIEMPPEHVSNLETIVELIKSDTYNSVLAMKRGLECKSEGVVARSRPLMLFSDKTPIMWKLKNRDYKQLRE